MTTFLSAPGDWGASTTDEEAEDLAALGMSIKDADALDKDADALDHGEEDDELLEVGLEPVLPAALHDDEPQDGLAALQKMEEELDEPELDLGEDEEE